ncbi:hypothetical protein MRB53_012357 [Persea americana]|uniref:Uncharacterized protein n=1 Tax=Persea americana TaxID=3435 RepID=A0ACC2LXG9_PERAE|nr:hypothetical protein MRB53_012357 [Persea americana]
MLEYPCFTADLAFADAVFPPLLRRRNIPSEEIQTHDLRICRRSPVHHQFTVHGLIFNNSTLYLFKKDTISCAIIIWCACDLLFTFQGYPLY